MKINVQKIKKKMFYLMNFRKSKTFISTKIFLGEK